MKKLVLLFLVLLPVQAYAVPEATPSPTPTEEDRGRESSINLAYDHNPGNLSSLSLGGDIALSKQVGTILNYKSDQLPSGYSRPFVNSFGLGLDDEFTDVTSGGIGYEYSVLPNEVFSKGFNLGGHFKAGKFRFGLIGRSLHFTTDNKAGGKKLRENGLPERSLALDVAYKFHPDWKVKVSYTGYSYGGATPSELSTVLSARKGTTAGLLDAVDGFPKSSASLGLFWQASDPLDFDLTFTSTKYELVPDTSSGSLGANYQFTTAWGAGPSVTALKQDGQKAGTIISVQTSYTWN
jgi:hypothetical protein